MNNDNVKVLNDVMKYLSQAGLTMVRMDQDKSATAFKSAAEDKTLFVMVKTKGRLDIEAETIGFQNLTQLNTLLNTPEYQNGSVEFVFENEDTDRPSLMFKSKNSSMTNKVRLMAKSVIEKKLSFAFKGAEWHLEFAPSDDELKRFMFQGSLVAGNVCRFITKDNRVSVTFGSDEIIGETVVKDELAESKNYTNHGQSYSLPALLAVLKQPGNKTIKLSNAGLCMVELKIEQATFEYIVPGLA